MEREARPPIDPVIDHIIDHATLLTFDDGRPGPQSGPAQGHLGRVEDGALAVGGGRILAVGRREAVWRAIDGRTTAGTAAMDAGGRIVMPGLVDAHTHLVWDGSRADEFEARLTGATYLDLLAAGGGINATVRATRAASFEALERRTVERLDALLEHGVTTAEVKTGYGLTVDEELRHLDVLAAVAARHPVRVVPTFLGAHAFPAEFAGCRADYVAEVIDRMLPAAAAHPLAADGGLFCDVFCDEGAFDPAETRAILTAARARGLGLKVHADEFANLGAAGLAAELGAASADHLVDDARRDGARPRRHGGGAAAADDDRPGPRALRGRRGVRAARRLPSRWPRTGIRAPRRAPTSGWRWRSRRATDASRWPRRSRPSRATRRRRRA
ncbi:MAG: amidohydrolase family protein [Anaerolineae bacterium]